MVSTVEIFSLAPPPASVPIHTFILSGIKMLWMMFVSENPLVWGYYQGRAHPRADLLGPAYVLGAPGINFAPGKGVLGATQDLKNGPLFLFSGKILGPNGEPIKATLDLWQTNTIGSYSLISYRNRGKITTDPATGKFEVLTIPPAEYGISKSIKRAAHIHACITAPGCQPLITQFYMAARNDPKPLVQDMTNWTRAPRMECFIHCWAIPTDKGETFWDFPHLTDTNIESTKMLNEWDDRLKGEGMRINCGASSEIRLNAA